MLGKNLIQAAAGNAGGEVLGVEDVFSTWLYTGNGSTQTITNGIDLSGEGGMVWIKDRDNANNHQLFDTARGSSKILQSNLTNAQATDATSLTSFNSTGFSVGDSLSYLTNYAGVRYASWTFRKAAKFFDVVTYTGDGTYGRTVSHNLGSVPGCIIVKRTDSTSSWTVYHRSIGNIDFLELNATSASQTASFWANTTPTSTQFSTNATSSVNASGGTYVAYLFAHDAGGFGDSGNDSVVKCGSFTTDGSSTATVTLGWEPQWLMLKRTDSTGRWWMLDTMRGIPVGANDAYLGANESDQEFLSGGIVDLSSTGFSVTNLGASATYVYIAIRRGPMKTPTDATKVFSAKATSGTNTTNFPVDMFLYAIRAGDAQNSFVASRLTGGNGLSTALTSAERADGWTGWDSNTTRGSVGTGQVEWDFRRAPGFFDVVAYTGTGFTNLDIPHNLGVPPEIIITKRRDAVSTTGWFTSSKYYYSTDLWDRNGRLNDGTIGFSGGGVYGPDANITSTQFRIASNNADLNTSGGKYIAYLFATCPGVSKCGGYTGTGTTLSIDCGFTNGARFVLIKRADAAGDWYVWDTARGIVSGNDPYLLLNSTAAEVTSTDYIDPLSSGFQISSTAPAAINASGGSFIFLAIA